MHLEYTIHMRGVDVANHLEHHMCLLINATNGGIEFGTILLNQMEANTYIVYILILVEARNANVRPIIHLQFKTQFCEIFLRGWWRQDHNLQYNVEGFLLICASCQSNANKLCGVQCYILPHILCHV